ncbi:MAG: hypothetical protein ACLP5H_23340 [Desulfomonilaceae bacterium]
MDEKELAELVQELLIELNRPERHLSSIVRDFDECGIDYCVIGSMAVRYHNYLRYGDDIDVLVSRESYPKIEKFLIGNGYSRRPGSDRHLYLEFVGGRIPLDVYVEGEKRGDGRPLPDPTASRIKRLGRWYASLPLLITLKIRDDDLGDVFQMIRENELGEEFAANLEPDVREKFLEMLRESERSA